MYRLLIVFNHVSVALRIYADEPDLAGLSSKGLNDCRSLAYVTRKKSVVFTGRSSYDLIKYYEVRMHR